MSGTVISRVSSLFRHKRPFSLRRGANYVTKPTVSDVKKTAEDAKRKIDSMASNSNMSKEEMVGWGIIGYWIVRRICYKTFGWNK